MRYKKLLSIVPIVSLVIALSYWVYCCCHGFDMSDEGFLMTLYRDFSEGQRNIASAAGYPLTCWLGGKLLSLCPDSLLAFRLMGVAMYMIMGVTVYFFLRNKFSGAVISLGLLTLSFVFACDPKPFGYNGVTAFFSIMAIIPIVHGIISDKPFYLVLGGLILGINSFVRLPNVALVVLGALPFFALEEFTVRSILRRFRGCAWIFLGFALGLGVGLVILKSIGCWSIVVNFVRSLVEIGGGDSSHSFLFMLERMQENYIGAFLNFILFFSVILALSFGLINRLAACVLIIAIGTLFTRFFITADTILGKDMLSTINGIALIGTARYFYANPERRIVAGAAVLLALLMPLGSDFGFVTSWCGPILAYPIGLCGMIDSMSKIKISYSDYIRNNEKSNNVLRATILCMVIFSFIVAMKGWRKAYFDPGSRHKKTSRIWSVRAKGIKTCEKYNVRINPLFSELRWYVKTGDTVLAYDWAPMLYYLLGLKAYGGVAWPCVLYGVPYVNAIEKERNMNSELPVVVLQHYRAIDSVVNPHYYDETCVTDESHRKMIVAIKSFISQNNYRKVWSNGWYDIYLPPNRERFEKPCLDWWDEK